jgi:hypothetical protein
MKVKAKGEPSEWVGYYNHIRRRGGDVFTLLPIETKDRKGQPKIITPENQFTDKWMIKVDEDVPESKPAHFNKIGKGQPRPEPDTDKEVL